MAQVGEAAADEIHLARAHQLEGDEIVSEPFLDDPQERQGCRRAREAAERARAVPGSVHQAKGSGGHHGERSLGSNDQMAQVVSDVILAQAARSIDDLARGRDVFEAENEIAGHAVAHDVDPTRIGRDDPADPARALAAEADREQAACIRCRILEMGEDAARFRHEGVADRIDGADGLHPLEGQNHRRPGVVRGRRARQPGMTALRNDRGSRAGGPAHQLRDLGKLAGTRQAQRLAVKTPAPVGEVGRENVGVAGEDVRRQGIGPVAHRLDHARIDDEVLAGAHPRCVGGQEHHHRGDIVRQDLALEGLAGLRGLPSLRGEPLRALARRHHPSGRHAIDADARLAELPREGAGEADHRRFRGGVGDQARRALHPGGRAEVDDRPAADRRHLRNDGLADEHHVAQVHRETIVPIRDGHVREGVSFVVAGIVDEDRSGTEPRAQVGDRRAGRLDIAQVRGREGDAASLRRQAPGQRLAGFPRDVDEPDPHALRAQGFHHGPPDAVGAAGDEGRAAREIGVMRPHRAANSEAGNPATGAVAREEPAREGRLRREPATAGGCVPW